MRLTLLSVSTTLLILLVSISGTLPSHGDSDEDEGTCTREFLHCGRDDKFRISLSCDRGVLSTELDDRYSPFGYFHGSRDRSSPRLIAALRANCDGKQSCDFATEKDMDCRRMPYEVKKCCKARYKHLGCWADRYNRAIPTLEGTHPRLDGDYHHRHDAIEKCYQVATSRGFTVFAVQDGGWCAGSTNAENTYRMFRRSSRCLGSGKGGPNANDVYSIRDKDPCKKHPCLRGSCVIKGAGYTCKCESGWEGKDCDRRARTKPSCVHGHRYPMFGINEICHCVPGWTGQSCDQRDNACESGPCKRGSCEPRGRDSYYCRCPLGWAGQDCEQRINHCNSNPCLHGLCENSNSRYTCKCKPGWSGTNCNTADNMCTTRPCQRGRCEPRGVTYRCMCPPGWTGRDCSQRIDYCKANPCRQGSCENGFVGYTCKCRSGWTGTDCDKDINECLDNPCTFGTCANTGGGYACRCDSGWTGTNCTKATPDKSTLYLRQDSRGRLVCPHGVVKVASVQYEHDHSPGYNTKPKACRHYGSLNQRAETTLRRLCDGRWYCDLVTTSSVLFNGPDPCDSVKKALKIDYTCVKDPRAGASASMKISAPNTESNADQSLTVICRATGNPPPSVTWRRGGEVVTNGNGRTIVKKSGRTGRDSYLESHLTITQQSKEDDEGYVCLANSKGGKNKQTVSSSMVKLLVGGIVITVLGVAATACSIFFIKKNKISLLPRQHDSSSSTDTGEPGSPMTDSRRPLANLPKPSVPKLPAVSILELLKPIPVGMLKKEFNRRRAYDEKLFNDEYEALPKLLAEEYSKASMNNREKNRFRNIMSYDHSRVILNIIDDDPRSDYINASYIDGYHENKKYIATQGPMYNTVDDFWRMMWDSGSTTIVMLANLVENCQNKVCKYWSETDTVTYGDIKVTLTDTTPMDYYIERTFAIVKTSIATKRNVIHFHFLGWPDFGVPDDATDLLKFHNTVMAAVSTGHRPIVVHCSAGVGRTGTFITIDAMIEMMAKEKQVDVFGFVSKMRRNRSFMVQAKAQYVFIYQALLQHLRSEARGRKWWPPPAIIALMARIKQLTGRHAEDA